MELFPITLPKQNICQETELYYRSTRPVQHNEAAGQIILPRHSVLTLDTYFNCFSYSKYQQYTCAAVLEVHMKVQGEAQLRLMKAEQKGRTVQRTVLLTQQVRREQLEAVTLLYDFSRETGNGFLYLEVTALSKEVVLEPGYYGSPIPDARLNPTKLAAVICTYKREDYVKRNLQHLNQSIFAQPQQEIARHVEVFVVDNGKTLDRAEIETEQIRLFPNKNCGGSGGFTRGIIEALRRREEFSHVLLMDDDILLESNVLIKTIRFLQIVRPEHADLAIGGSMLRLDRMQIQHEAGGRWNGYQIINYNHNLDLTKDISLLQNEALEPPQYNAWWYCCIPLCLIDENNLPLPFFIKVDDIEYGMRITRKLLVLNGVGIWHEPFEKKQSPQLTYYDTRNKLVVNTLYEDHHLLLKNMLIVLRYMGKNLLRGYPEMAEFAVMGCRDYLKGVSYFKETDLEQQHQLLSQKYKDLSASKKHSKLYGWLFAAGQYIKLAVQILMKTGYLKREYQCHIGKITSEYYWSEKLEIEI